MSAALAILLILAGLFFFLAGTVGMLRFPDVHARLHAVTKADNLGLGLLAAGVALLSGSAFTAGLLVLIWLLALVVTAVNCHLLARHALLHDHSGEAQ